MILVTGGTGFLGRDVVPRLAELDDVRLLSRQRQPGRETVVGDISDPAVVRKAMKGVDCVVHMAKFKGHTFPYERHHAATVLGTRNVFEAAEAEGVDKVVHMSTAAVKNRHATPYSRAKREAEKIASAHWRSMDVPIIRCSLIYDRDVVAKLRRMTWFPLPYKKQRLHLSYKTSVVDALLGAVKYGRSEIYEVGDKRPILSTELYRELARPRPVLFVPPQLIWLAVAAGHPVEKLANLLGVKPPFTPAYVRYLFEDRTLDIARAVKVLRYKPVDTLETVRRLKS